VSVYTAMTKVLVVLCTQLFSHDHAFLRSYDDIVVIEDSHYVNTGPTTHPLKLAFYKMACSAYVKDVAFARGSAKHVGKLKQSLDVHHVESTMEGASSPAIALKRLCPRVIHIDMFHPISKVMVAKYSQCSLDLSKLLGRAVHMEWLDTPAVCYSVVEFHDKVKYVNSAFYKQWRVDMDVLMSPGAGPLFGRWSTDADNQSPFPPGVVESHPLVTTTQWSTPIPSHIHQEMRKCNVWEAASSVGMDASAMMFPVTQDASDRYLDTFIHRSLLGSSGFAEFQDALSDDTVFANHSAIAMLLNCGLLTPRCVIDRVKILATPVLSSRGALSNIFNNVEAFLRQICWREFMACMYYTQPKHIMPYSYLGDVLSTRASKSALRVWLTADTSLDVLNKSIDKLLRFGYVHHIERLMIMLNAAVLYRLNANDVYDWFNGMFVDGMDYLMANIHMATSSLSGGKPDRWMTRCYIHTGSYLSTMKLRISASDKKQWRDLFDSFAKDNPAVSKDFRLKRAVRTVTITK